MTTLLEQFMAAEVRPFAIAAMMILVVGLAEAGTMLIGFSLSEVIGKAVHFDSHSQNSFVNAISWLNVGGVPLLIFLLLFLGIFSISGFLIQDLAGTIARPLPTIIAAPLAFGVSMPLLRQATGLVSRAIPRDESYAVEIGDLVGRVGEVVVGPLDHGLPGRVRVQDLHGNLHFVAASAAPASDELPQGASVLLVDRDGTHFLAIAAPAEIARSAVSSNN
jgi:Inner membrane protein YqiJ, N-terminal/Inner membrane protein YqiJ, OB-fold